MQLDKIRYTVRLLANGWAVWDLSMNTPAAIDGMWQVSLSQSNAIDLANELNHTIMRTRPKFGF
jgi:hypothetical protein